MTSTQAERDAKAGPYIGHLNYEAEAMVRIAAWYTVLLDPDGGPAMLYAACLEAMLVHCRSLIEFLIGRPRGRGRSDRDFGANALLPDWDNNNPLDTDGLADFLDGLDVALAHLSMRRIEQADRPSFSVVEGVNLTHRSLKQFVTALEDADSSVAPVLRIAIDSKEEAFPLQRRNKRDR